MWNVCYNWTLALEGDHKISTFCTNMYNTLHLTGCIPPGLCRPGSGSLEISSRCSCMNRSACVRIKTCHSVLGARKRFYVDACSHACMSCMIYVWLPCVCDAAHPKPNLKPQSALCRIEDGLKKKKKQCSFAVNNEGPECYMSSSVSSHFLSSLQKKKSTSTLQVLISECSVC